MHYFVLGSWYALLPIGTAFLISIVYGSFSNYVIEYFNRIQKKETNNKLCKKFIIFLLLQFFSIA